MLSLREKKHTRNELEDTCQEMDEKLEKKDAYNERKDTCQHSDGKREKTDACNEREDTSQERDVKLEKKHACNHWHQRLLIKSSMALSMCWLLRLAWAMCVDWCTLIAQFTKS